MKALPNFVLFLLLLLGGCSKSANNPTAKKYHFDDDPVWQKRDSTSMIVVHHSDSTRDNVETIRRFHTSSEREFNDIGYHYVILNGNGGSDGEIKAGRDEEVVGAHAKTEGRNFHSVGICLVGKDTFTDKQKDALVKKLVELCRKYGIKPSAETIVPHHATCPGTGLDLTEIINRVKAGGENDSPKP